MIKNIEKLKKISLSNLLFYIAFFICMFPALLCTTAYYKMFNLERITKICYVIGSFILFIKCLLEIKKINRKKRLMATSVIVLFSGIVIWQSKSIINPLLIVEFVICSSNIDRKKIIQISLFTSILIVVITLVSYFFKILPNEYTIRSEDDSKRWYLGFNYTTHLPNLYFFITLMYVFLRKDKIKIIEILIALVINRTIYYYTDTKAIFYEIIMLYFIIICMKIYTISKGEQIGKILNNKLINFILKYYWFFAAAIMIILMFIYNPNNEILEKINLALTGRLNYATEAWHKYGINLFGTEIVWQTGRYGIERFTEYFFVDSSFVNLMLNYGVITLILICLGFTKLNIDAINKKEKFLVLALIFLALHSMVDPQLFDLRYNPFVMFIGAYFSPFLTQIKIEDIKKESKKDIMQKEKEE